MWQKSPPFGMVQPLLQAGLVGVVRVRDSNMRSEVRLCSAIVMLGQCFRIVCASTFHSLQRSRGAGAP